MSHSFQAALPGNQSIESDFPSKATLPEGQLFAISSAPLPVFIGERETVGTADPGATRPRVPSSPRSLPPLAPPIPATDPVTGLLSYHGFQLALEYEIERAVQTREPVAMLVFDVADFRLLNDTHGTAFGDEVLRVVAAVLTRSRTAYSERIARLNGDEFAMLLPGVTQRLAEYRADRLSEEVRQIAVLPPSGSPSVPIAVTVGIALFPDEAETAAILLRRAQGRSCTRPTALPLYDQAAIRRSLRETVPGFALVESLIAALDQRDTHTRLHCEDTMCHAVRIARQMHLTEEDQRVLMVAALLHDIGKIVLPDRILRRPDALSAEDYETVKMHPTLGAEMVESLLRAVSEPMPEIAAACAPIRFHHERWDGGGYPAGLHGVEIPLLARILAVADAYSAMTLDRPYRKALPPAEALYRLRQGSNSQWDMRCVNALLMTL
jgi:diguanylate cyclase (GGDEF)-like protein/putative nucleotidyltransferase with HDIG domain